MVYDIHEWLNFIFKEQGHKKLRQITTIKSYWTKSGDDRDPAYEFEKMPNLIPPGQTAADVHGYNIKRLLEIEKVVPNVKLGKVDLGYFSLEEVFMYKPEYVQFLTSPFIHKEWYGGRNEWHEEYWRVAMVDFGKFKAYTVETSPTYDFYEFSLGQAIFIDVPRINVNYKKDDKEEIKFDERIYMLACNDRTQFEVFIAPHLKYPSAVKDFFIYMHKEKQIFGKEFNNISSMALWTASTLNNEYAFPMQNIKTYDEYKDYLTYCKENRLIERYFQLPSGISVNYDEETFAKKLNITQEDIDNYLKDYDAKSEVELIYKV